jgi:hypothetical protein
MDDAGAMRGGKGLGQLRRDSRGLVEGKGPAATRPAWWHIRADRW